MLGRKAWYNKLRQQTFENNSDRFRNNLDPFTGIFRLPVETIMKAYTKLTLVMCCNFFDYRYAAPSSGDFRRRPSLPKACGLSWRNGFLLSLPRGLRYPFNKKKTKSKKKILSISWMLSTFKQFKQLFSMRKTHTKTLGLIISCC